MVMTTIPAGKAKAQFLALLATVARTQQEIVVTKRGRPIARIAPLKVTRRSLKSRARITGDLIAPIDEQWSVP